MSDVEMPSLSALLTGVRLGTVAVASFLAGGLLAIATLEGAGERLFDHSVRTTGAARVGGAFSLVDHTGARRTDLDFRGSHLLVVFGPVSSADVVPAQLQVIGAALERMGPRAATVRPLLITLDPERDTPARMAEFVSRYHPGLVGLTGTREEIDAVARSYHVHFARRGDSGVTGGTALEHTANIYVMDRQGRYLTHFELGVSPTEIVHRLSALN